MTNLELAQRLRELRDFLIIAGYEESHATRYTHISRAIEKHPESILQMRREGRLQELPGVGKLIQLYIKEILDDGVSSKQKEWEGTCPITVLEMLQVPGLGPKTARALFQTLGVTSLEALKAAESSGALANVPGIGPKTRQAIQEA